MPGEEHRRGIRARLDEIGGTEHPGPGRALVARLLRSYVTKTPPGIDRLAELCRAGDVEGVRDQAHALKGSATNLGVTALAVLFAELESAARAGRLPRTDALLSQVRATYEEVAPVCTRLAEELEGPAAP
ncbi:Hpt domain-containing protein [Actinoplanes sp. N902-109]|uniref:Hpt domain-containing protein n=1 Tax=Actinoplanes sp. (strain N902-109) TaxID=649831 RepID=UPI0003293999|nr:Hpt domain-containing protein [Actinoplanes sp. N902-109]AGL16764.1 multi-sensor hybrid histidine kinase [Actinoplanes sp. N902-109]